MTNIKERVLKLSDYKGIKKEVFFKELGFSYANFKGIQKKSALNSDAVDIILSKYKDISAEWLISGTEPMLKVNNIIKEPETEYKVASKKNIPLIPLDAMAGFGTGEMQVMPYDTKNYIIPEFDELNVDFMIRVKGSSMYPKYNSGDIVACKKLPLDTFFQWNKVYVLDTIQGPMIKRICKSTEEDAVLCVSDNVKYEPFDLHKSELHSLSIVLGVIRLE
jgi:phage repressor protein C with HTH and peptisase S24 domain